jgi:RNase P/RNase MRP subunit p30
MDNYLLMKESEEALELSSKLGFTNTYFLDKDFVYLKVENKKYLLNKIKEAKNKKLRVISEAKTEELLRYLIEKTDTDIVIGMEKINPKDSVHFVRSGLDQVSCRFATENGKKIAISFNNILQLKNKSKLLSRIMFNLKLCRKYKTKTIFSNFSNSLIEMRAKKDLEVFERVLNSR